MSSQARPLHLLGRRRLDALAACVQQGLPELAREWWRDESRMQVVGVSMWNEALRSSQLRCVVRGEQDRWLAFLGTEQAWLKLAESWLGCEVRSDGPLVGALRRGFCLALYRQLVAADAVAVVVEHAGWSEIPAATLQPGGGALVIELDVDGIPLIAVAPLSLWESVESWPAPAAGPALRNVISALTDTALQIEVRLPGVRIAMTDLGSLAVGDFINLEQDLSGRVRVIGSGAQIHLSAVLGRHEGHKAVRIEHHSGSQQ